MQSKGSLSLKKEKRERTDLTSRLSLCLISFLWIFPVVNVLLAGISTSFVVMTSYSRARAAVSTGRRKKGKRVNGNKVEDDLGHRSWVKCGNLGQAQQCPVPPVGSVDVCDPLVADSRLLGVAVTDETTRCVSSSFVLFPALVALVPSSAPFLL